MKSYDPADSELWTGRKSDQKQYLHEMVECSALEELTRKADSKTIALLGYACDEGVRRNQGRIGAEYGPAQIRRQLAKLPNHLDDNIHLVDLGNVNCLGGNMESAQAYLAELVVQVLRKNAFPLLLGGGHDMAYGHFTGIKKYLGGDKSVGIINFDAHFDLRVPNMEDSEKTGNSGTPFYQIARDCEISGIPFEYLCLGIRKDANTKQLFKTAKTLGVSWLEQPSFTLHHLEAIKTKIRGFMEKVDYLYVTVDLDGFSSAFAPGASAASPMGFDPQIVLECLEEIIRSKKLISLDIAEMNPDYDLDHQTAKLAASLVHFVLHQL
ncbi:formimidoylglutamase [Flavobacteriaceae bacterium F89]|uniref:Formimidoylglutamase n=1 Tax=Cerina litoralis TaxID=2874477 RepID=A0AAE3ETQ9_9FLAO|nr:formimidoylglutamase [Cerina litoralis]MCG2460285.1 formimidoylglutamase [Cerina litoralis]